MNNRNTKISDEIQASFPGRKSYSIAEILAAGGATAFASKMGKTPESIEDRLKKLPKDAFLTKDEAADAIETLNESK
ncbi:MULTISPECIES: hypothetical protein [Mucilaginibacter]|uniref:Uncharacterized protein n=2 Tax=Mucilaginibacter gotjawali TaxID=1550579 RepID=A0A839SDJ4_9SPHI|nr:MULTISPECIES: hypothetical protein [Mucilaginibacter]MBB3055382.1 hypothetical protein [Mucilaginibacter gotjawali]MDR3694261.1 hypothetical protein [Mucilaginibacter sp.]BAU53341.1 hypothetical protein MgSA37_01508 [Mucilaginibacter gotjawali]